jgi:hypothetical protein
VPFTLESVVVAEWPAPVDFWLYTYLIIVQLDGEQHFYNCAVRAVLPLAAVAFRAAYVS